MQGLQNVLLNCDSVRVSKLNGTFSVLTFAILQILNNNMKFSKQLKGN